MNGQPDDPRRTDIVVGLGASAGGLEPLQQFIARLPADSGLAFVIVQHLEPHHPSMLVELLARQTKLPVAQADEQIRLEPDHVYVIAPGTLLTLDGDTLRAITQAEPTAHSPIDHLFRSLAENRLERAVGVLFSGAGHDGTAGLRTIKERGGLTIAQDPETARHESMPQSAIQAGLVDHVLAPADMPRIILEHAGYLANKSATGDEIEAAIADRLAAICELVQHQTGHDFGSYKEGTLIRRIRRRLQVLRVRSPEDYLRLIENDVTEAEALVKDLLIGVTQFFRDPEIFLALAQQVIPRLVSAKATDTPIRVWVAGCASGEEAYSIAILIREHLDRLGARRFCQIFATDLDAEMLAEARQGRYPESIAEQIGAERLARYFVREGQDYIAAKELRELCLFSQHSLIRDPPFSQLDLISCRNVLIYLSAELQQKLIPLFHYALRPGGFLFLGPSEGIAGSPELFEVADKKSRIFRRKETVTRPVVEFPLAARSPARALLATPPPGPRPPTAATTRERLSAAFQRVMLEQYTSPGAVVDERGEIVLVAGPIARFLQIPAGAPTSNLLESVPGSLRMELRAALQMAARSGRRVVRERVTVETDEGPRQARLIVRPMPAAAPDPSRELFLVVLQEHTVPGGEAEEATLTSAFGEPAVQQLESELRTTRAELKSAVEELESANEELKSSNEELISTNEELQSANEEMQTSKEELQSLNEELETVNTELRQKVDELGTANSDLSNLFSATEVATIFLDRDLHLVKFTPAATALFHLRESDVGRSISDFAPRFEGQDVISDSREVLRTLERVERQVRTADEKTWFIVRILPYRTMDNVIAGVVVTFVDVTELKRAEEALRQTEERFRVAQELSPDGFLIFRPLRDGTGVVTDFLWIYENDAAARMNDTNAKEVCGKRVSEVLPHHHESPFHTVYKEVADTGEVRVIEEAFYDQDTFRQRRWFRVAAVPIRGGDVAVLVQDVTARKSAEEALRESEERLRTMANAMPQLAWMANPDGYIHWYNQRWYEYTGTTPQQMEGWGWQSVHDPEALPKVLERWKASIATGEPFDMVFPLRGADGRFRPFLTRVLPLRDPSGRVVQWFGTNTDVSEIEEAREAARRSEESYRQLFQGMLEGFQFCQIVRDEDGRPVDFLYLDVNSMFTVLTGLRDVIGKRVSEVIPEIRESNPELFETYGRVATTGRPERFETYVPQLDRYFTVSVYSPVKDHFVAVFDNISERKRAEQALLRSRDGLSRLAEASLAVVAKTDLQPMLQAISEAALALTGARLATCGHGFVSGQYVVGGSARAPGAPACPPGEMFLLDKGGVHMALVDGAESIRLTDAELRAHAKWWGLPEGHVPMRGLLGVRMLARDGKPNGIILVTDKEHGDFNAEDEALLRQLATVASLALQHVEARISLEESDRRKNQFLAMLSHELRNPLAPIRNSLHILDRSRPGGEQARRAQTVIDRQVGHLTRLVDDLLDITRITRGKIQLQRERVALCDLVRRSVDDYGDSFAKHQLELELALPDAPLWINADRTRIAQLIGNLLSNATKFTPAGGTVQVSVECHTPLGQAVLRVRDSGIGIAPDMLPRVFEPFAQADSTLDRSRGGLGLGLAMVKGIVELHGGTASVESAGLGMGAEFTVRLPLVVAAPADLGEERATTNGGSWRVLIIEDNVDAAESLREVLALGEHVVEVAFSGAEGVEKARGFRPDVVLCDIGLPGMDGYDVAKAMRNDPDLREIELVALTGYAAPEDVARAREAGFDSHLAKPPSPEKLEQLLGETSRRERR